MSDDVVMTKLTKALQIQIGAVERYNLERAVTVVVAAFAICCSGNGCMMRLLFEFYLSTNIENITYCEIDGRKSHNIVV